MNNKLFIKNLASEVSSADLYVYGEIVDEKWWDSDVDAKAVRDAIEGLGNGSVLNLYVNSPGGSVFVASAMVSMLERAKQKGVTINAFVDGLAASAASFLIMAADNITMYKNSMLMIHKPMSIAWGNADELMKMVTTLNQIEDSVMMPLYEKKAKAEMDVIKEMIDKETWLSADEVTEFFNVEISDNEAQIAACADKELLKKYRNTPEELTKEEEKVEEQAEEVLEEEIPEEPVEEPLDYSEFENILKDLERVK